MNTSSLRSTLGFALLALCLLLAPRSANAVIRDGGVDPANLGQGGWLYLMKNATNHLAPNYIEAVTNENSLFLYMKKQGFDFVIVKAGTSGTNYWDGNYSTETPVFTSNLVNLAHANGLKIFGSNRSYGADIAGEIGVADYVFQQGADGFIYDAEAEWEASVSRPWITNAPAQAWWLCGTVRSNWPTKFIAHNPFDTLYLHYSFPYKEFGYWTDCVMPQVYHHAASLGNAFAAIHWMDVNYSKFQDYLTTLPPSVINGQTIYWTNSIKPLALMRDVYGANFTTKYPPQDVMNFLDYLAADPNCVTPGGYQGADYFRSELYDTDQWAYMKAATVGQRPGRVNNIVVDDARAAVDGAWTMVKTIDATTGATVLFSGATGTDTNSFGTNYFYKGQGDGSASMQFTPNILSSGAYTVYQWHPSRPDASASVPFIISHTGGTTTIYANQQTNDGNWSLLGTFNFAAGTSGSIRVTDAIPESDAVAMVDGLKLVFLPSGTLPPPPTGLNASVVSSSAIALAWTDNATNEANYVVARSTTDGGPYTDIASLPSETTNYVDATAAPLTTYYYVVRAVNAAGASPNCAQAGATTPAAPPVIVTPPASQTVTVGSNVTFTVVATGTAPLSYQWRFNGAELAGATESLFVRVDAKLTDAGSYSVVVTNLAGKATSAEAVLTLIAQVPPPTIDAQPVSLAVIAGQSATFTVAASSSAPMSYQWRFNGAELPGATGSAFTLSNAQTVNAGSYDVVVSNPGGAVTSSPATLAVNFSLTVTTTGSGAVVRIPNLSAYPPLTNVTLYAIPSAGYDFSGWSGDAAGSATPLALTMTSNLVVNASFIPSLTDLIVDNLDTNNAVFTGNWSTGAYSGKYGPDYRWASTLGETGTLSIATYRPPITVSGYYYIYTMYPSGSNRATNSPVTLQTDDVFGQIALNQQNNGGTWLLLYPIPVHLTPGADNYVQFSNDTGYSGKVVIADAVRFKLVEADVTPPAITVQPASRTVLAGATAAFTVAASGSPPLSYFWRRNGVPIPGATLSTCTIANAQLTDSGSQFSCLVSNLAGTALSTNALLTVLPPATNCTPAPANLLGWWRAEGSGSDSVGSNNATLLNGVSYTTGMVGQAFDFNGVDGRVLVPDSPALDVSTGDLTLEAWVRPQSSMTDYGVMDIVTKRLAPNTLQCLGYELCLLEGQLTTRLSDSLAGNGQVFGPAGPDLRDGSWHHVALTLARTSTTGGRLYVDGQVVLTFDPTGLSGSFSTTEPLRIGNHATPFLNCFFKGQIDEVSLYARSLAQTEIQAIYAAHSAGKCVPAPQLCTPPAPGLVSWWQGENSTADLSGGNSGTVAGYGTFGYGPGRVGQAFVFDGLHRDRVDVGNPTNLQLQDLTIEAWVKRSSATQISLDDLGADGSQSGEGGMVFSYGRYGYGLGLKDNGQLLLSRIDVDGILSSSVVADTNWHHVAVTKSGSTAVFYLDGVPASAALPYATTYTFDTPAAIGSRGDGRGGTFWGMVDEPSVYSRALSDAEIQAIYAAGANGKCLPPAPPTITVQPANQVAQAGDAASFSVTASGTAPLSYFWQRNGLPLAGATASSYLFPNAQVSDSGSLFSCLVSNAYGTALSSNALLTVTPRPCAVPPAGILGWWPAENSALDLLGQNSGTPVGGVSYAPGMVGQAFSFNGTDAEVRLGASLGNFGTNDFTLEFWLRTSSARGMESVVGKRPACNGNSTGMWDMRINNGLLEMVMMSPGVVDYNQVNATRPINDGVFHHVAYVRQGTTGTLYLDGTVEAFASTPGVTYLNTSGQLVMGRSACVGVDGTQYFTGQLDELAFYQQALSFAQVQSLYSAGSAGKCSSFPPAIVKSPTSLTVEAGQTAMFSALVSGTPPLSYQWFFETTPIPGATGSSLVLTGALPQFAGNYSVQVTNAFGSATSSNALLTVLAYPPAIVAQPANQAVTIGSPAGFTVVASGTAPLSYFWQRDGMPIAGATLSSYTLANAQLADSGSLFSCLVSNAYGTALSTNALLTVTPGPAALLAANFESGLQGFTIDNTLSPGNGLWHLSTGRALNPGHSPSTSLYYGQGETATGGGNYNVGLNGGAVLSPAVFLPPGSGPISLSFNYLMSVEGGTTYDVAYVEVTTNNGASYFPVAIKDSVGGLNSSTGGIWVSNKLDLSPFAGSTVQLRFRFNTVDAVLNSTEGWYLDDIAITAANPAPSITSQPKNVTVFAGLPVSFSVTAGGAWPLSCFWQRNGAFIAGATNSSYTLDNAQVSDSGSQFSCLVSNLYGTALSSNALLTVNPTPPCTPPAPGLVSWWKAEASATDVSGLANGTPAGNAGYGAGMVGQAFVFDGSADAVRVGNPTNLQLQNFTIEAWVRRANPTVVSYSTLYPTAAWFSYGAYGYGFGIYNDGRLFLSKIGIDEVITSQKITDTAWHHVALTKSGTAVSFYIDGAPAGTAAYGNVFSFSTDAALGARGDTLDNSFLGSIDELAVYSRPLSLEEIQALYASPGSGKCFEAPPFVVVQPAGQTVAEPAPAVFTVVAGGTPPFAYQWLFESNAIAGANGSTLVLSNTQPALAGNYSVLISNAYGFTVSSNALLTVLTYPPTLTMQPVAKTVDAGSSVSFSVTASGTAPLSYQWFLESNPLAGATASSLTLTNVQPNQAGNYSVVVTNLYGSVTSTNALLTVLTYSPTITAQPVAKNVNAGSSVSFSVTASGTAPLSYQWFLESNPLDGATASSLTLLNVQPDQAGNYSVVVTNLYGSVTSTNALLTVLTYPPAIAMQPRSCMTFQGRTTNFSVNATGTAPLTFQWYCNSNPLPGRTSSMLTLTNIQLEQAGTYSVLVTNAYGSLMSSNAVLTVYPAPVCLAPPEGIVAWWRAQSNSFDSVDLKDAIPQYYSLTYMAGKVGAAFRLNQGPYLRVPPYPDLDLGKGAGLTIEGWIRPDSVSSTQPIAEWNNGFGIVGAGLMLNNPKEGPAMLEGYLTDTNAKPVRTIVFRSPPYALTNLAWQHVALTFDKTNGVATMYVNGVSVAQTNLGAFVPATARAPFYLGFRPSGTYAGARFWGGMDEMSLYNRALSAAEIQSLFLADDQGKCVPPPPPCVAPLSGMVGWWRGETNALDSVATNTGTIYPTVLFNTGRVAGAFQFSSGYLRVPASSNLNVGVGPGLTIELWANPNTPAFQPLVEWNNGLGLQGPTLCYSYSPYGMLEANLVDTNGFQHVIRSPYNLITNGVWQHFAVTYDKASGAAALYVNGSAVVQTNLGIFTPRTGSDLFLGYRPPGGYSGSGYKYSGLMDEISVYGRALSAAEVHGIAFARGAGKCPIPTPPFIVWQPASKTVTLHGTTLFSLQTPAGTPPFAYQWQRSGTNLVGATMSSLPLPNVPLSMAGPYSVVVTNSSGSITSAVVTLTVNLPPTACSSFAATRQNIPVNIATEKLLTCATDPENDPLTVTGVVTSTNGATVVLAGDTVTYTPVAGFIGTDRFNFAIKDIWGGPATGSVLVEVRSADQVSGNMFPPTPIANGFQVRFAGLPGCSYTLQRAESVSGPWVTVSTVIVDTNGLGHYDDTNAPPATAFYRTLYP